MTTKSATNPAPEATAEATAEAEASNSPIVSLSWSGVPVMVPCPASNVRQGYAVKVRASSLTIVRANGKTETRIPPKGSALASVMLTKHHLADLLATVKAEATALVKANSTLDPRKAEAMAEAALWSGGTVTFNVHGRAARVAPVSLAGLLAQASTEAEAEAEPEASTEPEA